MNWTARDLPLDRFLLMQTFARVVETGSFSAVARELETGQPNVSRHIAALEKHLEEKTRFTFLSRLSRCGIALDAGSSKFSGHRGQPIRGPIEDPRLQRFVGARRY
jgi:hypothetical protein